MKNWGTIMDNFFKEILDIPLLTEEEEKALARAHDTEALVYHNLRLVVSIANKYKDCGKEFADIFQEGCIGLMLAVERYDCEQGRLSTFVYPYIKKYILKSINENYVVHVPLNKAEFASTVRTTRSKLMTDLGREPTLEEVANALHCESDKVASVLEATQSSTSLDAPVGDDEDCVFGDLVAGSLGSNPYYSIAHEDDCQTIRAVLSTLTPREATAISYRFGLDAGEPHTLEETGKKLGLGKERTRQVCEDAVRKLRHPARVKLLQSCLC